MGFFDKVKETASAVGGKVKETSANLGDKSKIAIEKQKIKSAISRENTNINKKYCEIGKKYFEIFGETPNEEFITLIDEIRVANDNITKLNNQLFELEDFVVCSCGARVPKGVAFCSNCGSSVVIPVVEDPIVETVETPNTEDFIDVTPTNEDTL